MFWVPWASLIILSLTLGAQIRTRSLLVRLLPYLFPLSVFAIFGTLFFFTYVQYTAWLAHPLSKFLLPPYQSATYFWGYVYSRFFSPWLIALFAGLLVGSLAAYVNRLWGGALFEEEEPRLLGLGIFLSGYPGFLVYLILVSFSYLCYNLFVTVRGKRGTAEGGVPRVPMYWFWLPAAIFAIIVKSWVIPPEMWKLFAF